MEYNQYISSDGSVYDFDNQSDRFLLSITGQGLPPVQHFTQNTPYLHGSMYLGYKLQPRVVRVTHQAVAGERDDYWKLRSLLLDTIRYNRGPGTLRKILEDGTSRDLTVYVNSGLTLDEDVPVNKSCWHVRDMVEFIAYDPIFYDPVKKAITFTPLENTDLEFPITFPITFGESSLTKSVELVYNGTWITYPTIVIAGPIDGPSISNDTTNEVISLNYSVSDGEVVYIDLSHGNKSVVNNSDVNLIGTVSSSSDLGTFHIECPPTAPSGVNIISVNGGGVTSSTKIKLEYYVRYIGI